MHIIVVNDFAHINGGASQVALSSALGLAEKGHRVTVFSAVAPIMKDLCHENIRVAITNQYEIVSDPNRPRAAMQGIWNVKAQRMIRATLLALDISKTVIHLHGWSKALSSSVIRECWDRNFKVVCTLHDYFTACPNGGFFNFRTNQICRLRPLSLPCVLEHCDARSYSHKQWRVIRQVAQTHLGHIPNSIHAFIAVSDFSQRILEPYLPAEARIFRVDNPIDIPQEAPASIDVDSPFIFVGRLSPEKGVHLLAAASQNLECDLVVVGEGSCRSDIQAIIPSARMTGWLPKRRLYAWLKKARALVLPSLWYETQGLVVAEAAALGIPSIVPDTSAARDMVIDGVTGLWFKGGSESSLRGAMRALRAIDTTREMGQAAYDNYWRNPATLSRHVENLEECYRQTLAA